MTSYVFGAMADTIHSRPVPAVSDDIEWPCSNVLKKVFLSRNVLTPEQANYPLSGLLKPDTLKDGVKATQLVCDAIMENQRILIIGDYDTDGATATTLGLLVLRKIGAENIDYLVPNRFEYGYGLSSEIAEVAINRSPDLVITVDNGINSIEGVKMLRSAGIKVIITDHHLPGEVIPDANAIVNPNQPDCHFPSKNLAGVGVMFYLLLMVRAQLKRQRWFKSEIAIPNLAEFLDLVALGTVADVVPLDYNNRILVSQGISRVRIGKCRPGIIALMDVAGRHYHKIISTDFGFIVAPRLNAAGRLDDIAMGIECLLSDDGNVAREYALQLNEINLQRKKIEREMQSEAMDIVRNIISRQSIGTDKKNIRTGFCLFDSNWHQGITGLVASRVKDKTGQPVVAFAETADGKLTGSARSVDGLHIKDMLANIVADNPGLVEKFGGHAMAAGLTIKPSDFQQFQLIFTQKAVDHFVENDARDCLITDGCLDDSSLVLEIAEEIRNAAPWGQGFPMPLFEGVFLVDQAKIVGEHHLKLSLLSKSNAKTFDAIAFRILEEGERLPEINEVRIVYQMDVNEFRGNRSLQLIITQLQVLN